MKVVHLDRDPHAHAAELLAVGLGRAEGSGEPTGPAAAVDRLLAGRLRLVLASGEFVCSTKEELLVYPPVSDGAGGSGPERVLLAGLGDFGKEGPAAEAEVMRGLGARAVRAANRLGLSSVAIWSSALGRSRGAPAGTAARRVAEGVVLAGWRFDELKNPKEESDPEERATVALVEVLGGDEREVTLGATLGQAANFARTLQSRPGNLATPEAMALAAGEMAAGVGLEFEVFDETRMRTEGMEAILAVSRGSEEEARLIVLRHRGGAEGDPPLALVGKGLTFDAGGISLKPALRMEEMKYDMSGGAAVIAAMKAIAELDVPVNVIGVVPASENLPSGSAVKPGDVIDTLRGRTVEVINTDAEGRLLLADALTYVSTVKPRAIVDCATLTGAAVVALGHHATAVLGNDDELAREILRAGERSGERCWRLPLWPEYRRQLRSPSADLANVGGRSAGAITAAAFLAEFVDEGVPWVHLDIAGTAYGKARKPYERKGAHGTPARLLIEWVLGRAAGQATSE